ncbi:MAG: metallophosphoesterase [Bacteroidales bacterium]|nr:metallophosphoesterase [Bacteroidales bacterium]
MKITHLFCSVVLFVVLKQSYVSAQSVAYAEWLFDNPENLTNDNKGNELILYGIQNSIEGPMLDDKAIRIGAGSYYIFEHGLPVSEGQKCINKYSILFDFRINNTGLWYSFFQTDPSNITDAEFFIRNSDQKIGVAAVGYSDIAVKPGRWYRLVVVVDNGKEFSVYLDGVQIKTGNFQEIDGRFGLQDKIIFFGDNNSEDNTIDIARLAFYNYPLSQYEVTEQGLIDQSDVDESAFLTGPYLQNVTSSGITIMWESEVADAGRINFGKSNELINSKSSVITTTNEGTYIHKTVLSGLESSTLYNYEAIVEGENSELQSFKTAPANDTSSFTVGIWGDSHYASPWMSMADFMVNELKVDFAFNTGDISNHGNNYSDLLSVFIPHVCERIGTKIPFFSTMGNHDADNNLGGGNLIRQFHDFPNEVNSDKNSFDGSYLMMYSNVAFISIDWNRMESEVLPNEWLETVLNSEEVKNARFRFIFIHCAPYYERWQIAENDIVKTNLPPLAAKYKVSAVFSGHLHAYERGFLNGVTYITQGGSSYLDVNEKVGPIIYNHIIIGTEKPGNPTDFYNGLKNHILSLEILNNNAIIKLHYFDSSGDYIGIIETVNLVDIPSSIITNKENSFQIVQSKLNNTVRIACESPFRYQLYDISGKCLQNESSWVLFDQFNIKGLVPGIYIINIEMQSGDVGSLKVNIN